MQRLPDTAPGRHLATFLQTFNAGDGKAIAHYVTDHYQSGIDVESETLRWLRHRSVYGPLELHSSIVSNDSTLRVFTVGSITKGWVELTARISRDQPARLRSIAVGEGLRPESPGLSDKPAASGALVEQVRGYLDRLATEGFFSGTVLVAKDDTAIFEAAFGLADRSHEVPIRADTKFNIGSITKIFTALAVLQLAEHGKLSLDDSAAAYLPDYPGGLDERIRI